MSRITMKDLMEAIQTTNSNVVGIQNEVSALSNRVSALETGKTTSSQKGKKQSATKPSKDGWGKYTPKKDADGNWNWRSYKACRNRYLEDHGFGYAEVGWMGRADFAKAVKPFEDKFGKYVKKADRK